MPSKKKPLPLHVSRALILREQADVIRRTQRRIDQLRATENSKNNDGHQDPVTITVHMHSLSTFAFVSVSGWSF
jgi:hypothetical protein